MFIQRCKTQTKFIYQHDKIRAKIYIQNCYGDKNMKMKYMAHKNRVCNIIYELLVLTKKIES